MSFIIGLLVMLLIFLTSYLIILIYLARKVDNYSPIKGTVSELGRKNRDTSKIFSAITFAYGVLTIILPYVFLTLSEDNLLNYLGALSLLLTSLSTMAVGIFPLGENTKTHLLFGYLAFGSVILTGVAFLFIPFRSVVLPTWFSIPSLVVVLATVLLAVVYLNNETKYALPEWFSMLGTIVWNFMLGLLLMLYLL